jgi:hypothetical protein
MTETDSEVEKKEEEGRGDLKSYWVCLTITENFQ